MSTHIEFSLGNGNQFRVDGISAYCVRLRIAPENRRFTEGWMNRYRILETDLSEADRNEADLTCTETGDTVTIQLAQARLTVNRSDGSFVFRDGRGEPRLTTVAPPSVDSGMGFVGRFALHPDEKLYGLGDASRDNLNRRGGLYHLWVRNVACYAPTPFLLSTRGWAVFVNTTRRHYFDLGHERTDEWRVGAREGEFDIYLIAGNSLAQLLDHGTRLTGRPALLPLFAYGLTFVCNQQVNAREMLEDCHGFRFHGIPCDTVGLEPGWMENRYDFSTEKRWHPDRFWIPFWDENGPTTFLGAAKRLGFRLSLWLCTEYDLTYEEERQSGALSKASATPPAEEARIFHPDDVIHDEHFGHGACRQDRITRPDEPWFEHLKKFVTQGVRAFKLDGANTVNEHPDRLYGNGCKDAEMHNLYPTLAAKQVSQGFTEHTGGKRAFVYGSGAYAGIAQFAATWAGDTAGGARSLVSLLNHGLSGHANTGVDADVYHPAGIHAGFLQPWAQITSWYEYLQPWLLGKPLEETVLFYARLRYRLLPYLYATAHTAYRTGIPILRAMPLAFPDLPGADTLTAQYMLGESLLVGAFQDSIVLPEGVWYDYWTGERFSGGQTVTRTVFPAPTGGFLFARAGAILPLWPNDVEHAPGEDDALKGVAAYPLTVRVFPPEPGHTATFTLYEDDGETEAYKSGAVAQTVLALTREESAAAETVLRLTIGERTGVYAGMPATLRIVGAEDGSGRFPVHLVAWNGELLAGEN